MNIEEKKADFVRRFKGAKGRIHSTNGKAYA